MTALLIIIFILSAILLIILYSKNALTFIWNNIGKPYIDYLLKPSDLKLAKRYLTAIIVIAGANTISKLFFGIYVEKNGESCHLIGGLEYGTIDNYTLLSIGLLVIMACCQFYFNYRKVVNEFAKRKKTLVVEYTAKIAKDTPLFDYDIIQEALPKEYVPSDGSPLKINYEGNDDNFWDEGIAHLEKEFNSLVLLLNATRIGHISLFAIAPMPLLVKLGTLLNEKFHVDVYQRHRNPANWNRLDERTPNFCLIKPTDSTKQPVIAFSVSADISERIINLYSNSASIWHVKVDNPNMDIMRTLKQQDQFRELVRNLLSEISGITSFAGINIHMAMPVSCAIELGRVWMPKAHKSLVLYDYSNNTENKTITIENNPL